MKVGYLRADNAGYLPNELEVRKTLDPVEDGVRIANEAPWVTPKIQGVLGTSPLLFEFVSVKVSDGGDAEIFKKEINSKKISKTQIYVTYGLRSAGEVLWSYHCIRYCQRDVMLLP